MLLRSHLIRVVLSAFRGTSELDVRGEMITRKGTIVRFTNYIKYEIT